MADQPAPDETAPALLVIEVAGERLALPADALREVARWRDPTPVPGAPPPIAGVISQRGAVLPVLDLRLARGRPATPPDRATRLVVVRHAAIDLALLVDAVHDLLPASAAAPPLVDLGALIAAAQSHS